MWWNVVACCQMSGMSITHEACTTTCLATFRRGPQTKELSDFGGGDDLLGDGNWTELTTCLLWKASLHTADAFGCHLEAIFWLGLGPMWP